MYNLESFAFHAKSLYRLNCVWICMYTFSFDKSYIYLEGFLVLMIFMFLVRNFIFELNCLFSCLSHNTCTLTSLLFSHDIIFMSLIFALYSLSVDDCVIFKFSWIYSYFIPYLKDFVLVFKIIIKLVALFFIS